MKKRVMMLVASLMVFTLVGCADVFDGIDENVSNVQNAAASEELTCMKIAEGEIAEVILVPSLLSGDTPETVAKHFSEPSSRFEGAYVDDEGRVVLQVTKEQAEKEFATHYGRIEAAKANNSKNDVKVEFSDNYKTITCFVPDGTKSGDSFLMSAVLNLASCLMVQEFAGVPYDDISCKIVLIYEPTGEVVYEFSNGNDYDITAEEWEEKFCRQN